MLCSNNLLASASLHVSFNFIALLFSSTVFFPGFYFLAVQLCVISHDSHHVLALIYFWTFSFSHFYNIRCKMCAYYKLRSLIYARIGYFIIFYFQVTKLDDLSPIIFLNRTKAALNCAAGSMQVSHFPIFRSLRSLQRSINHAVRQFTWAAVANHKMANYGLVHGWNAILIE